MLFCAVVSDCHAAEHAVLRELRAHFRQRKDVGSEYFEGEMALLIIAVSKICYKFPAIPPTSSVSVSPGDMVGRFVEERCDVSSGNRAYRCRATVLFGEFLKWKTDNIVCEYVSKLQFYKKINEVTDYDKERKIYDNNVQTKGWYGIRIKGV